MIQDLIRFLRHFYETAHHVRGILFVMLLLLSICVVTFALSEDMSLGNAVYLALITALSIGYGDIVPTTTVGRATSVIAGFTGVIFLGLMVAIATRAVSQSYEQKMRGKNRPPST